jgi:hypothetical protein
LRVSSSSKEGSNRHGALHQQPKKVAILGINTLLDRILARLLKREGYDTKLLKAYPTGHIDQLLDGVDVLLLSPYLDAAVRGAFLDALRSTPEAAQRVPVLSLPFPLKAVLLDELAVNVSWHSLFEGLVQEIEAALGRVEVSAEVLPREASELPEGILRSSEAA